MSGAMRVVLQMAHAVTMAFVMAVLAAAAPSQSLAAERNTIIYGQDYEVFPILRGGWETCEQTCEDDEHCRAWLFVAPTRLCRLKSEAGPTRSNPCCISGVKQRYQPPQADSLTGIVTRLHYNSAVDGRGACIQMDPELPRQFRGWACLWKDNPLYTEMSDLLLSAYRYGDQCSLQWAGPPRQRLAEILLLDCTPGRN